MAKKGKSKAQQSPAKEDVNAIEALAEHATEYLIENNRKNNKSNWHFGIDVKYELPIKKMEKIPVVSCIYIASKEVENEEIRILVWLDIIDKCYNDITMYKCYGKFIAKNDLPVDKIKIEISNIIKDHIANLKKLKFNKINNQFCLPEEFKKELKQFELFNDIFGNCSNMQLGVQECCVCYDLTATRTKKCEHPLCHICYHNLIKIRDYEDQYENDYCGRLELQCPMCRGDIKEHDADCEISYPLDPYKLDFPPRAVWTITKCLATSESV